MVICVVVAALNAGIFVNYQPYFFILTHNKCCCCLCSCDCHIFGLPLSCCFFFSSSFGFSAARNLLLGKLVLMIGTTIASPSPVIITKSVSKRPRLVVSYCCYTYSPNARSPFVFLLLVFFLLVGLNFQQPNALIFSIFILCLYPSCF